MAKIHELKTLPHFFEASLDGTKPFEIRKNDRDFHVGDRLHLHEWDDVRQVYTGSVITRTVTYITAFAQSPGWVVMGLSRD